MKRGEDTGPYLFSSYVLFCFPKVVGGGGALDLGMHFLEGSMVYFESYFLSKIT